MDYNGIIEKNFVGEIPKFINKLKEEEYKDFTYMFVNNIDEIEVKEKCNSCFIKNEKNVTIIEGVRLCGKSTLLNKWIELYKDNYIKIDSFSYLIEENGENIYSDEYSDVIFLEDLEKYICNLEQKKVLTPIFIEGFLFLPIELQKNILKLKNSIYIIKHL